MHYALYIASVFGAVALFMMMPRRGYTPTRIGGLIGAATLGGLWLWLARLFVEPMGGSQALTVYYYVFSFLAIGSAVRVITHTKPVFSGLWFIMVVVASAGLFLLMGAEFMAFAMVIIYGGAILVTYLFVLMLAAQESDEEDGGAVYDNVAREPAAAAAAGFLLLAVLLSVAFAPGVSPSGAAASDAELIAGPMAGRTQTLVTPQGVVTQAPTQLENIERVGLDLFESNPLGLELAGVILLVSLVGAVVIARKRVPDDQTAVAAPGPGGATVTSHAEPGPHSPETLESISSGRAGV